MSLLINIGFKITVSSLVAFMSHLSQTLVNPANGHIVAFDDVIRNVDHANIPITVTICV